MSERTFAMLGRKVFGVEDNNNVVQWAREKCIWSRLYSSPPRPSMAMLSVKRPRPWVCCAALYSLAFSLCSTLAQPKLPWPSDHASALDTRTMRETHDVTDSVSASKFDSFHGLSLRAAVRVNSPLRHTSSSAFDMKQLSKFVFVKNNDPTFHREVKSTRRYSHLEILIISCPAMQADSEIGTDISLAPAGENSLNAAV